MKYMSYIHNSYKCKKCERKIEYVWLYPDLKFETVPDENRYVFASHDKDFTKYEVYVKCPSCEMISSFEYSLSGEFKGPL